MDAEPTQNPSEGHQDQYTDQQQQPHNGNFDPSQQPDNAYAQYQQSPEQTMTQDMHDDPATQYTPPAAGNPSYAQQDQAQQQAEYQQHGAAGAESSNGRNHVVIKVGMVGDAQIGKTSLMVKYVEGSWDEDYIQTLGVNFMEKTISIRNTEITFSIWDLGGQREFVNMLPLVCNDAVAILFMFDLTRKSTLNSIKEWYRQGRGFNKTAIPILVGTKYDHFVNFPIQDQEEISNQVRPTLLQSKFFANGYRHDDLPKLCEPRSSSPAPATASTSKR